MCDAACSVSSYWSPLGHGSGDIEEQCAAEAESQQNTPTNRIRKTHGSPFSKRTPKNIYPLLARINVLFLDTLSLTRQPVLFRRKGVNTPPPPRSEKRMCVPLAHAQIFATVHTHACQITDVCADRIHTYNTSLGVYNLYSPTYAYSYSHYCC